MHENDPIAAYFTEALADMAKLQWNTALAVTEILAAAIVKGGKILVCGNGGSAADASHFAGELVGRFRREREGLPALSLAADTAALTAIGNDYGFERVFSRQVEALGNPGDVLVVLTTSGTSRNVLLAAEEASGRGMKVIAFTSASCASADWADLHWRAVSRKTSHAQEQMLVTLHGICFGLEVILGDGS